VALLRALLAIQAGPLVLAHINHQLRGEDSEADEQFVRALAAMDGPPLAVCCTRFDVAAIARTERKNLENVARRVRYDWLAEVAREHNARRVATGHTADDQAETVLHRLLRGTGLKGLAGIPAQRPLTLGVSVVRPLLQVTRAEVLAYLAEIGQASRLDRSNLDRRFTRNRIRHELLPRLAEDYNPAIVPILCRLAEQADAVYREVEAQARRLLADAELPRTPALLVFDRGPLAAASRQLVREVFRLAWERERWPTGRMNAADWDRIAAVANGEITATDLPGRIRVRCLARVVQVGPIR
jgi:tRNA(Ile)-lysidine synthase